MFPHMAAHEWKTEECGELVRLNENRPCLYNTTSRNYKDKIKRMGAYSDNNCSGRPIQSDIIFFVNFLFSCKQHYVLKVCYSCKG